MRKYMLIHSTRLGAFLGGICLLFFSCAKNETPSSGNNSGITLQASKQPMSKATETTFDSGDRVGVFIVRYANDTTPGLLGRTNYAANLKFESDAFGRFRPDSVLDWYRVGSGESDKSDFYAYYPYDAALDKDRLDVVPFQVELDQSSWANHTASDFLWASARAQTPAVGGVPMQFKHVMARFVIQVKATSGALDPNKLTVRFKNIKTALTWNLTTMEANNRDQVADVVPYRLPTPDAGYAAAYAVILPPQVITGDLVEFIYDGGAPKYWKPFVDPQTSYDICYSSQYILRVNLNINPL